MTDSFVGRIQASPDALDALAQRIRALADDLECVRTDFDASGALHSADIEGALDDFNTNWTRQSKDIAGDLHDGEHMLSKAAEAFRAADAALAASIDEVCKQ